MVGRELQDFRIKFNSIEFAFQTYGAGAAHANSATQTLNFKLRPFRELELRDLFNPAGNYLQALSEYCINELHILQPHRWYNPAELENLLARSGFRVENIYGDFGRGPLRDDSPEIVVVAERSS